MPKTLAQIDAQITKLQRQADALRAKEVAGVIARIKVAIDYYGLTAADLGFGKGAVTGKRAMAATRTRVERKRTAGVIRFRDEAGNSWTGHGKRPEWFKAAIAAGKTPEDLAVPVD